MIKVLYVVSTLQRTGPISFLLNLLTSIDTEDIEPIILTLSEENKNFPSLKQEFVALNISIYSLKLNRFQSFLFGRERIKKIVFENGINVNHTIGYRPDILIKKKYFENVKILSSIQSNIFDDYRMLYGSIFSYYLSKTHIESLKGKIIVSCSQFVREELKRITGLDSFVIYNSVSEKQYNIVSQLKKAKIREELGLEPDKKIFIQVGFLISRKDPITTIKGFIESKVPNSCLIILGDGPLMSDCKELARNHNNIIFKGYVNNIHDYLIAADFYISSSLSEGLPLSVLEAFGCGLPSLLSSIASHNELIEFLTTDFNTMFTPGNYTQLSNLISNITKENYYSLSSSHRKIIENNINSTLTAKEFERIYTY